MEAEIRGARLFYTDEGAGDPPMLFVHGFGCDSHDWSWQLPHFANAHRLVTFDIRGHGRSSAPDDGYDVSSLTADAAMLVEHVGCAPVVAVGHSLGGAIAASLAVERPDLVCAVVAVDPGHLFPDDESPMLAAFMAAYEQEEPAQVAQRAFDLTSHVAATPPALATWHNRRVAGVPEHVLRKTMHGLLGGPAPFILRANCGPYLARVSAPVLSFYVNPRRVDEVFTHPQCRIVYFEGSGHWLHQERPVEVNTLIDEWLASLP